jgi:DNA-binding transcriptional LysR family regulator
MSRITLEQWRMLRAVVQHGGFAQAAEALHKSQSTINYGVNKMQDLLGVRILEVVGRKARLTPAGTLVLRRAELLLDTAEGLECLAGALGKGAETELRLAVDLVFPEDVLFEVLDRFSALYPHTRIELMETVLSGGSELLAEGRVDLAIVGSVPTGMLGEHALGVEFIAVSSPDHPLQRLGRPITLADLRQQRQVVLRDSAQRFRRDSGWLDADQRWTVSHISTSIAVIRRGMAFAWLPETRIRPQLASGELKPLPLQQGQRRHADLYLCGPELDRCGEACSTLRELLLALARQWTHEYPTEAND